MQNKRKLAMYVYSDIKTDARVMRAVKALISDFDVTLLATSSDINNSDTSNYTFIDVVSHNIKNPLIRYLMSLKEARRIIKKITPDIIYGHDYYAAPIIAYLLKKSEAKRVYDAHELYVADSKSSKREHVCCHIEKKAIEKADLVVCASERRKKIMEGLYTTKNQIIVVDNISILPEVDNPGKIISDIDGLDEFFSDQRKTIVYCGALIKARRVDLLLKASKKLEKSIKALIIGSGEEKERLIYLAEDEHINNTLFVKSVPYKNIRAIISKCDVGYLYYENDTLNNSNCAPNKIYEYASADLPMVANNNAGLNDVLDKYRVGKASNDISEAISEVINNYKEYKHNISPFMNAYSWEKEGENLKSAIMGL